MSDKSTTSPMVSIHYDSEGNVHGEITVECENYWASIPIIGDEDEVALHQMWMPWPPEKLVPPPYKLISITITNKDMIQRHIDETPSIIDNTKFMNLLRKVDNP